MFGKVLKVEMGTYLNLGKTAYEEAINSEIFIDKSEMIMFLNTDLRIWILKKKRSIKIEHLCVV